MNWIVKQSLNIHFEKGEYWGFIYSVKGKIKNPEIIPGLIITYFYPP